MAPLRVAFFMALRGIPGFVGTRGRFKRIADGTGFGGWVEEIAPTLVVMRMKPGAAIYPGDAFKFTLFGDVELATFEGRFNKVRALDMQSAREHSLSMGTMVEVLETSLEFSIVSNIEFSPGDFESRRYARSQVGIVRIGSENVDMWITDVGRKGIGFVSDKCFSDTDHVHVEVDFAGWKIALEGVVRHSQDYEVLDGMYHTGIEIKEMDRITKAKWMRLFSTL